MKNILKTKVKKFLLPFYHYVLSIYRKIQNIKYRIAVDKIKNEHQLLEKIKELDLIVASDEKKIFYIIRRDNASVGLLTYVSVFLGHIAYAVSKGYIPIIDMQNFGSIYQSKADLGVKNAWEYYFKQPYEYSIDQIIKNEMCIYSPKYIHPASPFINSVLSDDESKFWKILSHKYIKLNDYTEKYFKSEYDELIKHKKVLGLLFRGTDYNSLKPLKHPIQPSIEQFVQKIKESIKEWGEFDSYYIATEEKAAVDKLMMKFPNKIIVNKRVYYDSFDNIKFLAEAKFDRENDDFLKGLEYLSSILLLSKCDSLIAGLCAGTYAANFMNEIDFRNKHFFYYGVY